jgi:hypothetical protein
MSFVLKDFVKPMFTVGGEVEKPGQFELRGRVGVLEAVAIAGGFKRSAKASQLVLLQRFDNERATARLINAKELHKMQGPRARYQAEAGDMIVVPRTKLSYRRALRADRQSGPAQSVRVGRGRIETRPAETCCERDRESFTTTSVQMGGCGARDAGAGGCIAGRGPAHHYRSRLSKLSAEMRNMSPRATWMRFLPCPGPPISTLLHAVSAGGRNRDLRQYDVVVSNCWGYAKGVHTRPDALHVCYCQTPPRWAWRYNDYVAREDMSRMKRSCCRG